jgi:hypothetical protein
MGDAFAVPVEQPHRRRHAVETLKLNQRYGIAAATFRQSEISQPVLRIN